ncbi:MAG: hypothetical protein KDB14_02225 [Planctomycetales bacterium]|nr:hypothetical protein [Planctomycetales bacterium]
MQRQPKLFADETDGVRPANVRSKPCPFSEKLDIAEQDTRHRWTWPALGFAFGLFGLLALLPLFLRGSVSSEPDAVEQLATPATIHRADVRPTERHFAETAALPAETPSVERWTSPGWTSLEWKLSTQELVVLWLMLGATWIVLRALQFVVRVAIAVCAALVVLRCCFGA